MAIPRQIEKHLSKTTLNSRVIAVFGPVGAGKTTLVKEKFRKHKYLDLKDANIYRLAKNDPRSFFEQNPPPIVLDEIQRLPELLGHIQNLAASCEMGQIVLISSHKIPLPKSLVEPQNIIHLLPFSTAELAKFRGSKEPDKYIHTGFMPGIYVGRTETSSFYGTYLSNYIESEVRQLINLKNIDAFEKFMKLLAERVAGVVNLNSLSREVGVSSTTLSAWLDVLEKTYIIFKLPSYFKDFGKRQTKSPKIYFTDVGFASYLAGIDLPDRLFKNMAVMEVLKSRYNSGKEPALYHFLDNHGFEIDLILHEKGQDMVPMEIERRWEISRADKVRDFFENKKGVKQPIVIHTSFFK